MVHFDTTGLYARQEERHDQGMWVWVHAKLLNTKLKIIIMLRGDE